MKPLKLIRSAVAKGFKGKFYKGQLLRSTYDAGVVDSNGDPVQSGVSTYNFEGLDIEYDDAYRARAGIPDTDLQILIFDGTIKPNTNPKLDDKIRLEGVLYQVRKASHDPAEATWTCQVYKVTQ